MKLLAALVCTGLCATILSGCAATREVAGMDRPIVIAHRGASAYAPENTVPAYELAWEMGADAAELDVQLTSEDGIIVNHDHSTDRTTGHEGIVRQMSHAELRALDAGAWKGEEFAGTQLPFLQEIYDTMPPSKQLYVEIKRSELLAVEKVVEEIEASGRREDTVIIAFVKEICEEAVRLAPDIPVLWLIGAERDENDNFLPIPVERAREAAEAGFAGLNVNINGITQELKDACDEEGITLSVWTVNPPEHIRDMVRLGVHAITTDVPDVARRIVLEEAAVAGADLLP